MQEPSIEPGNGRTAYFQRGAKVLLTTAAFVVVIAGIRAAEPILAPFLLSVFIAIISMPPLIWLKNRGVSMLPAMTAVIAGIILCGFALTLLVGSSVDSFMGNMPLYQQQLQASTDTLAAWLNSQGIALSTNLLMKYFDPQAAMRVAGVMLGSLGGLMGYSFLILVTVIFILLEAASIPAKLRAIGLTPHPDSRLAIMLRNIQHYIAIKTAISAATGIAAALLLTALGVDYAALWGLLAFLLNYIPNIGSLLAAVPPMLLALVQQGWQLALYTAIGYIVINVSLGSFLEPRVMGRGLGLSALVVFLSLIFWGWVLGPVGMLLSIPLTITVKIALESGEDTRWIAILLGGDVDE
jgi:predicted PurR-regulated permease PerM